MTITITEKEYEAIKVVLDQVCTDYEAATDEGYLETMGETIRLVSNVISKYKRAKMRAAEFQSARAFISKREPNLPSRDIDILTRIYMKNQRTQTK